MELYSGIERHDTAPGQERHQLGFRPAVLTSKRASGTQAPAPALGPGFLQIDHDTSAGRSEAEAAGASAPAVAGATFQPLALPDGWRLDTLSDDEYDPMRPTVWQEAAAQRDRDRAAAAARSAVGFPDAGQLPPPGSGAAPAAAPGPGRGIDQRPAWMVALDVQGAGAAGDVDGTDEAQDVVNSIGQDLLAPPSKPASVAAAIMQKHGHVEGQGLGRHGSGMTSALEAVPVGHGRGVVHQSPVPGAATSQPADTPSTVLAIRGWIDSSASADAMRAAEQHVREAGAAYGPVEAVVADAASARVFIQYAVPGAAATALDMLPSVWQHRYGVAMYPEDAFENLDFTAELSHWR